MRNSHETSRGDAALPRPRGGDPVTPDTRRGGQLAHVLRLCLDVHLDTMLRLIGATATRADVGDAQPSFPLARWLDEDMTAVRRLAQAQQGTVGGATAELPGLLGTQEPCTLVDDLRAHYRHLLDRLDEAADLAHRNGDTTSAATVADLRRGIGSRLAEMSGGHRVVVDVSGDAAPGPVAAPRQPGEYLG